METIDNRLQNVLDRQIGRGNVNNIVAAVQSKDHRINFAGAAGVADPLINKRMTPDTPYFIASITKMFTAAILMKLFDEGRVDLDAPINKYLPANLTRGIHIYNEIDYSNQIKISELISHTSGLADYETDKPKGEKSVMEKLKAGNDFAIETGEALDLVRSLTPRFAPGTPGKAHYSNTNYRLLGAVIESITEKPMAEIYQELICQPLGLEKTYLYDWASPLSDDPPATIFIQKKPALIPKYLSSNISDGGLVSTAPECLVFLRAFFEGQLFDEALLNRMMDWNSIFFPLQYGYGLMYFKLPRYVWPGPLPDFIGHSGSTGSFAFVYPARSLYLAGTVNQVALPPRPFFLMINLVRDIH